VRVVSREVEVLHATSADDDCSPSLDLGAMQGSRELARSAHLRRRARGAARHERGRRLFAVTRPQGLAAI
jgi:hypothetical protein